MAASPTGIELTTKYFILSFLIVLFPLTINVDGQATYDAEVAPLGTGTACPCPPDGVTRCLQNQCTLCGFGPNQPAGCPDGG